MATNYDLKKYPKIYSGSFAEIYDLSSELPGTALAFWKGFFQLSDKNFTREMLETAALVKKAGIKVFISDHSDLKVVSSEVLDWLHKHWYKNSAANGLLMEFAIDATTVFGSITLKKMLATEKIHGIKTVYINNFEDGKNAAKIFLEEEHLL